MTKRSAPESSFSSISLFQPQQKRQKRAISSSSASSSVHNKLGFMSRWLQSWFAPTAAPAEVEAEGPVHIVEKIYPQLPVSSSSTSSEYDLSLTAVEPHHQGGSRSNPVNIPDDDEEEQGDPSATFTAVQQGEAGPSRLRRFQDFDDSRPPTPTGEQPRPTRRRPHLGGERIEREYPWSASTGERASKAETRKRAAISQRRDKHSHKHQHQADLSLSQRARLKYKDAKSRMLFNIGTVKEEEFKASGKTEGMAGKLEYDRIMQKSHKSTLDSTLRNSSSSKIYTPTPATARRAQTIASKHSNEDVADILERLELAKAEAEKAAEARVRPSVPSALSEDEDRIVSAAFRDRLFKRSSATAEVHATSIERLRPGKWLNDEIINFYGGMLSKRSAEDKTGKLPKIFYCNTFFFVKMQGKYDKSFGRWTKKVNIFDLDLMIMPINDDGMHWVAAVMDMKAKRVEYYDSMGGTEEKANKAYNTIMRYFAAEHEAKLGTKFDAAPWTLQYLADQDNGVDCGVFTCQTLEMRSRGLELGAGKWVFGARNMPFLRRMMVYEIAEGKLYKRW